MKEATFSVYRLGDYLGEWTLVENKPSYVVLEHGLGTLSHTVQAFSLVDGIGIGNYQLHVNLDAVLKQLGRGPVRRKVLKVKHPTVKKTKQMGFGFE